MIPIQFQKNIAISISMLQIVTALDITLTQESQLVSDRLTMPKYRLKASY